MPEVEAPPLSASLERFRSEVDRRAAGLRRQRRRRRHVGVAVALVAVMAVAISLSILGTAAAPRHVALPSPEPASSLPTGGEPPPPAPGYGDSAGITGTGSGDGLWVVDRPTGFAGSTSTDADVHIVLAPPAKGRWGRAVITSGKGSVLSLSGQETRSDHSVVVSARTHRPGTAAITIPRIGYPSGSWHGTINVAKVGRPDCGTSGTCT